ncbi:stealth family protein [Actinomadura madurae]|uniref:stealth family protein n=1 Tax=Actinomadura madurae TaxID=1993 RepID=UPI000D83A5EE|nr:stealth family protein [Actinomadura madurae]SPT51136.1 Capsular polysaccharide phosphotransferase SacB [Actinomadura madurae]
MTGVPGRVLVRDGRRRCVAEIRTEAAPIVAHRENLAYVCAGLRAAGVEFFRVRGHDDLGSAVAVAESDRARVLAALRASAGAVYLYSSGDPRRKGPRLRPGFAARSWHAFAHERVIRFARYLAAPGGGLVLGPEYGCDLEFWAEDGDCLVAPRSNRVTETVRRDGTTVRQPERRFTRFSTADRPCHPTRPEFAVRLIDDVRFPIDVVYTWVDDHDRAWRAHRDEALARLGAVPMNREAANASRFVSRDELRYSLRSLALYAPWVRHIWLVTAGQVPDWLDSRAPGITVVDHREIFRGQGRLPTFNSHAIESQLHHIDGLAEHFLYVNDDVFFGRPVLPGHFFHSNGMAHFFLSRVHVDPGPVTFDDPPVMAAGKNNRHLIEEAFGRTLTQKMKHVPHPLRRSVLAEMEVRFASELAATAGHQFRDPADISLPSALHHYYGYMTGRSMPGEIRYVYTDLADRDTPYRLRQVLSERSCDVFCLNDTDADEATRVRQRRVIDWFLAAYFPVPGPYEKDSG